jgi:hypothetical protein
MIRQGFNWLSGSLNGDMVRKMTEQSGKVLGWRWVEKEFSNSTSKIRLRSRYLDGFFR